MGKIYKKLLRGVIYIMVITMLFGLTGCNEKENDELKKIYDEFEGKTLLIGGWVTPRAEFVTTQEDADKRFKELADAGITMMYTFDDTDDLERLQRVLNAAEKNNIKIVVSLNYEKVSHSITVAEQTKDHPAVIGYNLKDEPPAYLFSTLSKFKDKIVEVVGEDKIVMINLLPNYAPDGMLGVSPTKDNTSYQVYVEKSMQTVESDVLCMDYYMFRNSRSLDNGVIAEYFRNMFDLRHAADKYNIDLWGFLQNSGWDGMRQPKEYELRFSAHVNLAFGLKCLAYFLCWNPHADSVKSDGSYNPTSMISYDGKITDNYYLVKSVNDEIHAMKGVYLDYQHKGIILKENSSTYSSTIPSNYLIDTYKELVEINSDSNTIIGCFEKDNQTGLYVVNGEYLSGEDNKTTLKLDSNHTYRIWGMNGLESQENSNKIELNLKPGEGKFIQIID